MKDSAMIQWNGSQIFDSEFAKSLNLFHQFISFISIIFLCVFLLIIFFKTPTFMKRIKIYLISCFCSALITQIIFLLLPPMMLHPCYYFYGLGMWVFSAHQIRIRFSFLLILKVDTLDSDSNSLIPIPESTPGRIDRNREFIEGIGKRIGIENRLRDRKSE